MVGVEDSGPAATFQRHLQGIETELHVKAVGELPAEHMPGVEIHDRHQVQEFLLQWDVRDVDGPDLDHRRELPEIHQEEKPLAWIAWNCGPGFLVDRTSAHAPHEVSDTVATDRDPISGQISDHTPAAPAGIPQIKGVNPGHDL
jgi:hypothetical protein